MDRPRVTITPKWGLPKLTVATLAAAAAAVAPASAGTAAKPGSAPPAASIASSNTPAVQQSPSTQSQTPSPSAVTPADAAAKAKAEAEARAAAEAAARRKAEIDAAKARCTALLAKLDTVVIHKDPIDDQGECGTLAPVELVSVGKTPQVALSPPAIVNCDMAAAIHDWIKLDVQPLARKHLGQPVVRVETMSSYSCRNAFGRKGGKLSEHGKANALDIRGFVTISGKTAYLLEDWGLTGVEIAALAAKAEQERKARELADAKAKAEAAAKLAQQGKGQPASGPTIPVTPPAAVAGAGPLAGAKTIVEGLPKPGIAIGGAAFGGESSRPTDFGIMPPSRLGGPKPPPQKQAAETPVYAAAPAATPAAPGLSPEANKLAEAKATFLRSVHQTACKRFMTTLGPEADKYHRNHFHIDLAERRTGKQICE